jgi:hypothetical protein
MTDPHVGWNRLEATLITIKPGETITVDALVTETGLLPETIETVLNTLTKAELFERKEKSVFVRRRLLQALVPPDVPAVAAASDYRRRYGVTNPTRAARAAPSRS